MIKKNRISSLLGALVSLLLLSQGGCKESNKHQLDLSGSEVTINIERFEGDLFEANSLEKMKALDESDSEFMEIYKYGILSKVCRGLKDKPDEAASALLQFVTHPDMQHLYKSASEKFQDVSQYEEGFSQAFSYYHHYFPNKLVPKVYTFVSPFEIAIATLDSALAIGLDLYMEPDFSPYYSPDFQMPLYKIKKFRSASIVADGIKAWLMSEFVKDPSKKRLLDEMIYEGKILYAMDALLPNETDSIKMGYLDGQIEWCEQNEYQIWNHLVESELLFSSDQRAYNGVLVDGPFSKGNNVPHESSPRVAAWAGWQIIKEYMDRHPQVTLDSLMRIDDADLLLKDSKYKP